MRLVVVDRGLESSLRERFDETIASLQSRGEHSVEWADTVLAAPNADGYFVCSSQSEPLLAEMARVADDAPARLGRIILVGPAFDFAYGWPVPEAGTVADAMEKYGLGGWISPEALTSWDRRIGLFAGPKALMGPMQTNALKAFQSEHYATWFASRCDSLAEFLGSYLRLMAAWGSEKP